MKSFSLLGAAVSATKINTLNMAQAQLESQFVLNSTTGLMTSGTVADDLLQLSENFGITLVDTWLS